jgi:anti-sigma factor RsiW
MSDCSPYEGQLHDWVDRELDREPASAVARHVEVCPRCAEIVKGIRHLKALVRSKARQVSLPEKLESKVREAIALESLRVQRRRVIQLPMRSLRWAAAAVIVVVGATLGFQLIHPNDLHAQMTEWALDSHLRTLGVEDLPRFQCMRRGEVEKVLSDGLGFAVKLPEFPNDRVCLKGVSVEDADGYKVGKVFYRLDGEEFSLFVLPAAMRGGEALCCCHSGKKLKVYCSREEHYCFTYVTTVEGEKFRSELLEPALHRAIQIHRPRVLMPEPTGD